LDFKRALVRVLKGTFCKSIGRLLEAKRACISFEEYENSLQTLFNKEYVVCRRLMDIASNYVYHGSRRSVCM